MDREIRAGDVFRFSYSEDRLNDARNKHWDLHWCFDGQLIAKLVRGTIYLADTYWINEERAKTPEEWEALGTLKFICNLQEVVKPHKTPPSLYYDDADIFNLSYQHGCYQRILVRNGAKQSQSVMLSSIEREIGKMKSDIEYKQRSIERLNETREKVLNGDLDVYIL